MPTLKTVTLGCKVNQYETQYLREGFGRLGYREIVDGEEIEVSGQYLHAIGRRAEAKSRKIIRRLAKQHPKAELLVTGCYAARAAEERPLCRGVVEVVGDTATARAWPGGVCPDRRPASPGFKAGIGRG